MSAYFAVAESSALGRRPLGVVLEDRRIALAREEGGAAFALPDLCPHRGAPLSRGSVVRGRLRCPYHGIAFDGAGRGHAPPWMEGPCTLRTEPLAVHEAMGLVFVAREPSAPLPPRLASDGWQPFGLAIDIDAPAVEVVENFMDSTHTGVVHAGLIRTGDASQLREVTIEADERKVEVRHAAVDEELPLVRRWLGPGAIDHVDICHLPGTVEVRYAVGGEPFFHVLVFVTPRSATRSSVFVRGAVRSPRAPAFDRFAAAGAALAGRRILAQDKAILEATEDAVRRAGSRPLAYQRAEAMHPMVRRLLRGEGRVESARVQVRL